MGLRARVPPWPNTRVGPWESERSRSWVSRPRAAASTRRQASREMPLLRWRYGRCRGLVRTPPRDPSGIGYGHLYQRSPRIRRSSRAGHLATTRAVRKLDTSARTKVHAATIGVLWWRSDRAVGYPDR